MQRQTVVLQLLFSLLACALPPAALGQQIQAGPRTYAVTELRANPTTWAQQELPNITLLSDGRILLAWQSRHNGPTDCYASAFLADGTPTSGEYLLNPFLTGGWQYGPTLAPLPGGSFAAAWGHESASEYVQLFSDAATPAGFQLVNSTPPGSWPAIGSAANGDFVVAWGRQHMGIGARRYAADGTPHGPAIVVNTTPLCFPNNNDAGVATVAVASDGRFCVVWHNGCGGMRARLYDASGVPMDPEFTVDTPTSAGGYTESVAAGPGTDWTIAWGAVPGATLTEVFVRTFDSAGAPRGDALLVNETTDGEQYLPSVAVSSSGERVVCWSEWSADADWDIWARVMDPSGAFIGPEFRVNQWVAGAQLTTWSGGKRMVAFAGERIHFAWYGSTPDDGDGVGLTILTPIVTPDVYCAGDGSAAACPCGNRGAPGRGCGNSVEAAGAQLGTTGLPSVSMDDLRLHATAVPPGVPCLFVQGTQQSAGGSGVPFGDGLRCAGGTVVRLVARNAIGQSASYPHPGDPSISLRGGVPPSGGTYHYQLYYRDAAAFCTPASFNLSNGVTVGWSL